MSNTAPRPETEELEETAGSRRRQGLCSHFDADLCHVARFWHLTALVPASALGVAPGVSP
ncbi:MULTISPECIES: hypothetical protein [unclassified Marinovum]